MSEILPPALFPLTRCPACGYALTGLGNTGRCPECGESYDNSIMVLFGWPHSRFRNPGATILYVVAICFAIFLWADAGIGLVALIAVLIEGLWHDLWFPLLMTLGYGAGGAGLFFLALWSRRRTRRNTLNPETLGTPLLQLRLSPLGYGYRRGYGPVEYLRWIPDMELDCSRDGSIAHLRIARLAPVGTIDWSTVVDIAFAATSEQVAALLTHINVLRASASRIEPPSPRGSSPQRR